MSSSVIKKAFTLVELLVVIAIISVLAGMLMPALENAISSARQVSCMNNQKQIGMAVNMYVNDWSGYMPPGHQGAGGYDSTWAYVISPYLGGGSDSNGKNFYADCFGCPSDEDPYILEDTKTPATGDSGSKFTYGYNETFGHEYLYNNYFSGAGMPVFLPKRITEAIEHSSKISNSCGLPLIVLTATKRIKIRLNIYFLGTGIYYQGIFNEVTSDFWHNGYANALAVDGSVFKFSLEDSTLLYKVQWMYNRPYGNYTVQGWPW